MGTREARENIKRLALPYYGSIVRPGLGLEHVFIFADVDMTESRVRSISVGVWDPKKFSFLGDWIRQKRVHALICSDRNAPLLEELAEEGIAVHRGEEGTAEELAERWSLREKAGIHLQYRPPQEMRAQ